MENNIIYTYAAYSKNKQHRLKSSSGAIFTELATKFLDEQGVVYGVSMSDDCYSALYMRITDKDKLWKIRGSKYLQATIGDTFINVKNDLVLGKKVLFTGTGCYVNGLKNYLGKEYENLLCVDIICHGTPSPKLWEIYAKFKEKKYNGKLISVNFRSKSRKNSICVDENAKNIKNKSIYISRHIDHFFELFVSDICLRPSCYNCNAKKNKLSDMTIGDFWGIDNVAPELNDNLGISLVLLRTEKGLRYFNCIKKNLCIKQVTYEQGVDKNKAEFQSYEKPNNREDFCEDITTMTFRKLYKKYINKSIRKKLSVTLKFKLKELKKLKTREISHEDYGILLYFRMDR